MTDKKPTPQKKKDPVNDSPKSISAIGKTPQQITDQLSISNAIRLGIPKYAHYNHMYGFSSIQKISSMMSKTSSLLQNIINPSSVDKIERLYQNIKDTYRPFSAFEYMQKNQAMLDSILGSHHSFLHRQSHLISSISEQLKNNSLFSKYSQAELYGLTEDWKELIGKGILGSTLEVLNQPDLEISDLEEKIEDTLNEEEILLENKEFTDEFRKTFDKQFSSSYKLAERIENEATFLFYRLMNKYGLSVQAARNFVQVVIWASLLYIGVLAKELMTPKKEDRKPNITNVYNTYNNVYNTYVTDTVFVKTPIYRRSSDKTKRHATIPTDSIVSVFKEKGVYSCVETVIDSALTGERRIVRGWIKSDSLKSKSSN
ncbi:MAG: hypothetical protein ACO1N0_14910 [Fluviicola sp.]